MTEHPMTEYRAPHSSAHRSAHSSEHNTIQTTPQRWDSLHGRNLPRSTAEIAADVDQLLRGIEPLPKIPEEELAQLFRDCQGIPTEVTKRPLTNPWGKILLALNEKPSKPNE